MNFAVHHNYKFYSIYSLTNYSILAWSKLKVFADNIFKPAQMAKFVLDRVENNVGKGENPGYKHFLLFQQCLQMPSFSRLSKHRLHGKQVRRARANQTKDA